MLSNSPRPRTAPATLYQVAAMAGVSHQTVSRVINKSSQVAPQTRARVMKAISVLAYRPNKAARILVSQRSTLVGVLTFCQEGFGPSHLLISVDTAAMKCGYNTLLASITEPTVKQIQRAANDLLTHGVDGIILNVPTAVELASLQSVFGDIPFVVTDAAAANHLTTVTTDHEKGACLLTEHLINLGHRQIACISGPLHWRCGLLRRDGWRKTLFRHQLPEGPSYEGEWSARGGHDAALALLQQGEPFTAIVAGNDQMALGVIRALTEKGISVPKEVSVTGYDNMPEAAYFQPALTTVVNDFELAGRHCLESLIRLIRNPQAPPRQTLIEPKLICRESTGRCR